METLTVIVVGALLIAFWRWRGSHKKKATPTRPSRTPTGVVPTTRWAIVKKVPEGVWLPALVGLGTVTFLYLLVWWLWPEMAADFWSHSSKGLLAAFLVIPLAFILWNTWGKFGWMMSLVLLAILGTSVIGSNPIVQSSAVATAIPSSVKTTDLTILPGEWTPWLSTTSPNWNIRSPEMACAAVELKAAESHFFVYCPEGKTPPLDLYPGVKTVRAIPNVHAFSQRYRSLEDTEFVITVTDW